MTESINIWDAIRQMRELSKQGGSFSITFMSYSRERRKSDGIIEVTNARLRPQDSPAGQYSDYMLNYVDIDSGEAYHFWQPCLMYFNNQRITIK
jgi:hypothetical protein